MPFISSVRGSFGPQARLTKNFNAQMRAAVTGGTVTTSGNYRIHTFQFAQTGATFSLPAGGLQVEYLVVGAGGGGSNIIGGGGGAGGFITGTATIANTSTTITVGQGFRGGYGYNSVNGAGVKGGNSSIGDNIIGYGGGAATGWSFTNDASARDALINGGSGAGGSANSNWGSGSWPFSNHLGGQPVAGQGYAGGNGGDDQAGRERGGGGGGAGAAGGSGYSTVGNGGNGLASSISGTSVTYAGGGGAGRRCSSNTSGDSVGGSGGGGNGSSGCSGGSSGTNGLGGGGGGGAYPYSNESTIVGGSGGHGVVIIRYPAS
jgi:hypothetical protein